MEIVVTVKDVIQGSKMPPRGVRLKLVNQLSKIIWSRHTFGTFLMGQYVQMGLFLNFTFFIGSRSNWAL